MAVAAAAAGALGRRLSLSLASQRLRLSHPLLALSTALGVLRSAQQGRGSAQPARHCNSGPPASPSRSKIATDHAGTISDDSTEESRTLVLLKSYGCTESTVAGVAQQLPREILRDFDAIRDKVRFLEEIGLGKSEVDRVVRAYPRFLGLSLDGRVKLLFKELSELGFSADEVKKVAGDDPGLLMGLELGELSECMGLLKKMKCRKPIRERIMCDGALQAALAVRTRVDHLIDRGLRLQDAFKVLYLEPRVILYSLRDIEKKIDFLVNEMELGVEYIAEFPKFLGMNLEKQIVVRHKVIKHLQSNGMLGEPVGTRHYMKLSRQKFYNLHVKPYPECEKLFERKVEKAKFPVGLCELFKPQNGGSDRESKEQKHSWSKSLKSEK